MAGKTSPLAFGSGVVAWGNNVGILDPEGIKGTLAVSASSSGFLMVANGNGTLARRLDGETGLQSTAGDLAEAFPSPGAGVELGSVMVIDPNRPVGVRLASEPYDRRVVGVVAGAQGYEPGITLRGLAEIDGGVAVTLTGTVYCLASSLNGPIRAGDLLTTSPIPGHAMKATDPEPANLLREE